MKKQWQSKTTFVTVTLSTFNFRRELLETALDSAQWNSISLEALWEDSVGLHF